MAVGVASLMAEVGVTGLGSARRDLGRFEEAIDRTGQTAGRVGSTGFLGLSRATLAISGGAAAAGLAVHQVWDATVSVQDALAPLGTILGASSDAYADLTGRLEDFIASSPQSAAEIGQAAYLTLSAGITETNDAMAALGASKELAQAGLGTIGESANLVTSALASFTGENLTAQKAAQLFFGAISSGKTTTSELAQGFGNIAPLAASAGVKFNDLLAATAAMTSTGQSASEAYTGLKGVISGVLSPTKEASDAAEDLGLNFSAAHLKSVGLPGFLNEVKKATGGNVETMATLFGGVEALNAVLALTGPQAKAFQKNLTGIGDAGENLTSRSAEMEGTLSNRWAELRNKVTVALSEIGMKAADWLIPKLEELGAWVRAHWPQISAGFARAGEIAKVAFGKIAEVTGQVAGWVRRHWPEISATISDAVETVRSVITDVVDTVMTLWNNFHDNVYATVERVWPAVRQQLAGIFEVIRGVFGAISPEFGA